MKKTTAFIIIVSIIIIWFSGSKQFETKEYCGRVKFKIDATTIHKQTQYADPILVMDFNEYIYEVHPNWNTYMEAEMGEELCFDLRVVNVEKSERWLLFTMIGILLLVYGVLRDVDFFS